MDVPPRKLPPKKEVMIALLAESNVFVHLDPRKSGVIVPKWLQNQPELTLQLGLNMPIPIPDLDVEDDGISCTLSFSRAPFWCKLPWSAVFAIVSEKDRRGVVWPDDVPAESQLVRGSQKAPAPKPRPKLTALGPNDRLEPEQGEAPESAERSERTPPADAKCASCATRWPEEQSACPVCGGTDWIGASESSAASSEAPSAEPRAAQNPAAPPPAGQLPTVLPPSVPPPALLPPAPIMRPTLVERDANPKKRSSARPRGKTNSKAPNSPRGLGLSSVDGSLGTSGGSGKPRTRPELVPDRESSGSSAEPPVPTTLALFPPRAPAEASDPGSDKETRSTTTAASSQRETTETTETTQQEEGNKKPSKRPLPPYLRVVK